MNIFNYDDYKLLVNDWIEMRPSGGRGQLKKMAEVVGTHSVVMSQTFRGDRDLSLDHALELAKFMGYNDKEVQFFLLLVSKARSASHKTKSWYQDRIQEMRSEADQLSKRFDHSKISDENRARFYSKWIYSGVRIACSLENVRVDEDVAAATGIEIESVRRVLSFLKDLGLVIEDSSGLKVGPMVTHVSHDNDFVLSHHRNWRLKSIDSMDTSSSENLFYTGPMTLSSRLAKKLKGEFMEMIERTVVRVKPSKPEAMHCLNLDWFRVDRN